MLIKILPTVLSIWLKHRSSQPLLAFGGTYWLQITLVGIEVKSCRNFCQMNVYILKRYFCKSVSVNRCMYYWKGWKLIFPTFAAIHTVPSKKASSITFISPPKKLMQLEKHLCNLWFFSSSCSDPPPYTTPDSSRAESFVICNDGISTTPLSILSPFYHQWSIWKLNIYL